MTDAWHAICREPSLCSPILDYVLELLGTLGDAPWEMADAGQGQAVRIVRPEACAIAAALNEIFKVIRGIHLFLQGFFCISIDEHTVCHCRPVNPRRCS